MMAIHLKMLLFVWGIILKMSKFDYTFKSMCEDILDSGIVSDGETVRPKWEDGSDAHTVKKFAVVNRYDVGKEFPVPTQRPLAFKSCVEEMLWIWQLHSNNVNDLNTRIWDSWADSDGSIGTAYGYQIGKESFYYIKSNDIVSDIQKAFPNMKYDKDECVLYHDGLGGGHKIFLGSVCDGVCLVEMNQIDKVIYDLVHTPFSRRIIAHMYNFDELSTMNLYPCAYSCTFNVTVDCRGNKVLNLLLNQRSQDILAANAWNVSQYSVLLHMVAHHVGMRVGELVHVIADAHIYDRHIPIIQELIERDTYEAPTFRLNKSVKDFYDFTVDDVSLINYKHGDAIKGVPIAV